MMLACYILSNDDLYGCLEYDLQAELGIDVADFWNKKLSMRRLIMFLRHLPSHSALAARNWAGDNRWGSIEEQLASVVDHINVLDYHFITANGGKNVEKPNWVERPNVNLS